MTLRLEGPIPPATAALVESDLRTAFGRRGVVLDRQDGATGAAPDGAPGTGAAARAQATAREVVLTVVAASERLDQVVLTLEGAGASTLTRRLNLAAVPPDGRVLALLVAADEMVVASDDERLVRRRAALTSSDSAAPVPPAPAAEPAPDEAASPNAAAPAKPEPEPAASVPLVAVATRVAAAAAPAQRAKSTAAATFAFDHFTGGQTQLGFDVTWTRRVRSRAYGLLAAQGRQGLTASDAAGTGTVETRLLGGRMAAGLSLIDDGGPLRLGVDLGARAAGLWLDGHPQNKSFIGHDPGTFILCADAMLTADVRLGRSPVSVRLAAGGAVVLVGQVAGALPSGSVAQTPSNPVTGLSGTAFESQGGIVLDF